MSVLLDQRDDDVPPVLNGLDEAFRCKICGEHFRSAVTIASTKCGHSFCSECIRSTFSQQLVTTKRQRRCPQCNYEVQNENRELVKNFVLQEAVAAYKSCLPLICQTLVPACPDPRISEATEASVPPHFAAVRTSGRHKSLSTGQELASDHMDDENTAKSSDLRTPRVSMDSDAALVEEGVQCKKPMANYAGKKKRQLQELVRVLERWSHMERFLAHSSNTFPPLLLKCKHEGLRIDGTEEKLKKRHQEWILFYNAETDAIRPRSERVLRQEFNKRERACTTAIFESTTRANNQAIVSLIQSRPKDDSDDAESCKRSLTSGNPAFDKLINDNFKAMIAATRARQQRAKHTDCEGRQILPEGLSCTSSLGQAPEVDVHYEVETGNTIARKLSVHESIPSALIPVIDEHSRAINNEYMSKCRTDDLVSEWESAHPLAPLHSASNQSISFPEISGSRHPPPSQGNTSTRKRRRFAITGPWTCPKCTYYNEKYVDSKAKCEMGCGGTRPKPDEL